MPEEILEAPPPGMVVERTAAARFFNLLALPVALEVITRLVDEVFSPLEANHFLADLEELFDLLDILHQIECAAHRRLEVAQSHLPDRLFILISEPAFCEAQ